MERSQLNVSHLSTVPSEFEGCWIFLDTAHRVYYKCWGKNLDELLRPVPECNDFKYIAKEQIHSLGIRDLNYRADVLLVRKEYEDAYEELRSWERNPLDRGGGAVVLGHPGIGRQLSPTVVSFADNRYSIQEKHVSSTISFSAS